MFVLCFKVRFSLLISTNFFLIYMFKSLQRWLPTFIFVVILLFFVVLKRVFFILSKISKVTKSMFVFFFIIIINSKIFCPVKQKPNSFCGRVCCFSFYSMNQKIVVLKRIQFGKKSLVYLKRVKLYFLEKKKNFYESTI